MSTPLGAVDFGRLSVYVPEEHRSNLCVQVQSQDGRYRADLTYELTRRASAWRTIFVPIGSSGSEVTARDLEDE